MEPNENQREYPDANKYPEAGRPLVFTDMQGIVRKGAYNAELHGYQELGETEVPAPNRFVFPEGDIVSWEYRNEST